MGVTAASSGVCTVIRASAGRAAAGSGKHAPAAETVVEVTALRPSGAVHTAATSPARAIFRREVPMMPGKPVAARGKRFSPAELEAARRVHLADVIADDLMVLFCGANPGLSSAAAGAPFATPSDRWWPALYESGFTPRRLAPNEAHELLALGLGLTSLVRRPTVGVAELAKAEFVEGGRLLRRRVLARHPRWLAVLGVTAYRAAFARPDAAVGLQEDTIGSTRLWILPNPSGLNAHYPPRALATEFARLRVAAGLPDRSRRLEDATLCQQKGANRA